MQCASLRTVNQFAWSYLKMPSSQFFVAYRTHNLCSTCITRCALHSAGLRVYFSIWFDVAFCVHYHFNDALKLIAALISPQMIETEKMNKKHMRHARSGKHKNAKRMEKKTSLCCRRKHSQTGYTVAQCQWWEIPQHIQCVRVSTQQCHYKLSIYEYLHSFPHAQPNYSIQCTRTTAEPV